MPNLLPTENWTALSLDPWTTQSPPYNTLTLRLSYLMTWCVIRCWLVKPKSGTEIMTCFFLSVTLQSLEVLTVLGSTKLSVICFRHINGRINAICLVYTYTSLFLFPLPLFEHSRSILNSLAKLDLMLALFVFAFVAKPKNSHTT